MTRKRTVKQNIYFKPLQPKSEGSVQSCSVNQNLWKDFSPDGSRTTRTTASRESRTRSLSSVIAKPAVISNNARCALLCICIWNLEMLEV